MKVQIVQVGEIQPNIIEIIIKKLNKRFKSKFYPGIKIDLPAESYNKFKNQYNSDFILERLEGMKNGEEKVLGITSKDLYSKDLNFVFGACKKDASIVSTARFDPEFYGEGKNFEKLVERATKEIIKSLGIMFGLKECPEKTCIMAPAKSVSYLDDKKNDFCNNCEIKISMEDIRI